MLTNLSEIVKKDLDKYAERTQNNSAEFKKILEKYYGTMMSTNWRLFLTMVHLVALHGDKVMPVVLAMHNYSWYAMTNEQWVSTHLFDTDNGNYVYGSASQANCIIQHISYIMFT